ncbi:SMI1/KNR4 family protein [Kineococcus auxinigenes]|uniref:hypothetical protein n=1 Tax=unclassified Kineococcus TaxID=2621656 RepID=UPI003D7D120A
MSELPELLRRLEAHWRRLRMPIATTARPGLPPERVRQVLSNRGLAAPGDVLHWWAWHDGADSYEHHGRTLYSVAVPDTRLLSLDAAVNLYEEHVLAGHSFPPTGYDGWLPIARHGNGSLVVVDCRTPALTATTTVIDRELQIVPADRRPSSLAVPVRWWVEFFDEGLWRFDTKKHEWIDLVFERSTHEERELTGLI